MKHVTFADKSLLVGDEAADLAIELAAGLAHVGDAEKVELRAINSDGNDVEATFLLGAASPLMAETANTDLPEPDNSAAIAFMSGRLKELAHVTSGSALPVVDHTGDDVGGIADEPVVGPFGAYDES